jgi:predicted transcriptional regulator
MSNSAIKIYKKNSVKGEDGYKTFSIRIKEETVVALDDLATKSNRSRNELINIILEHAVHNIEVIE